MADIWDRNTSFTEQEPKYPSSLDPSNFIHSNAPDYTLGGKIDPYEYIDDWEAKTMFNASKQDVEVARAGGAKLGSLGQKILGTSGYINNAGQYIADPSKSDPNASMVNAIKKYGFPAVKNQIEGDIFSKDYLDVKGLGEFNKQYEQEIKSRKLADTLSGAGCTEDDVKARVKIFNSGDQPTTQWEYDVIARTDKAMATKQDVLDAPTQVGKDIQTQTINFMNTHPINALNETINDKNISEHPWLEKLRNVPSNNPELYRSIIRAGVISELADKYTNQKIAGDPVADKRLEALNLMIGQQMGTPGKRNVNMFVANGETIFTIDGNRIPAKSMTQDAINYAMAQISPAKGKEQGVVTVDDLKTPLEKLHQELYPQGQTQDLLSNPKIAQQVNRLSIAGKLPPNMDVADIIKDAKSPAEAMMRIDKTANAYQFEASAAGLIKHYEDAIKNPKATDLNADYYSELEDAAFGRIPPEDFFKMHPQGLMGSKYNTRGRLVQLLKHINPDYNMAEIQADYKSFSDKTNRRQISFIDNADKDLKIFQDLSDQLERTDLPTVNKLLMKGEYQLGGKTISNFETAKKVTADVLANALQGSGVLSDFKIQFGNEMLDSNVSAETLRSNIALIRNFLQNKKSSVLNTFNTYRGAFEKRNTSTNTGLPSDMTPDDIARFKSLPPDKQQEFLKRIKSNG